MKSKPGFDLFVFDMAKAIKQQLIKQFDKLQ